MEVEHLFFLLLTQKRQRKFTTSCPNQPRENQPRYQKQFWPWIVVNRYIFFPTFYVQDNNKTVTGYCFSIPIHPSKLLSLPLSPIGIDFVSGKARVQSSENYLLIRALYTSERERIFPAFWKLRK